MKYIALLRGINISGKNKISMSELKLELEKNKYQNVSTYLNSGNVIFATCFFLSSLLVILLDLIMFAISSILASRIFSL